jgi:hypothetical protein
VNSVVAAAPSGAAETGAKNIARRPAKIRSNVEWPILLFLGHFASLVLERAFRPGGPGQCRRASIMIIAVVSVVSIVIRQTPGLSHIASAPRDDAGAG